MTKHLVFKVFVEATYAQQTLTEAKNALKKVEKERQTAEADIARLSDPAGFGAKGEWKKLDGTCLEKDVGE